MSDDSAVGDPLTLALSGRAAADGPVPTPNVALKDVTAFVGDGDSGEKRLNLLVEGVVCGACVMKIERVLKREIGVSARLNLTTRRLVVGWEGTAERGNTLCRSVERLGYRVAPFDPVRLAAGDDQEERELLRCMAIAGFAAANVMLLSVSVWAGHASGMGQATRDLLHWFSALVALPAIAYAGRPFYRSAFQAVKARHLTMDVPISVGVVLATLVSVYATAKSGEHAYFDSAVSLLFFLLIGRFLDRRARGRARSAVERMLAFSGGAVTVLQEGGTTRHTRPEQVALGERVLVATGERLPVDGRILEGVSSLDTSLITGETLPQEVAPGDMAHGGTVNLGQPLILEVTATGEGTVLAEIVRLMEAAEQKKARHVALADRISRAYAPIVHIASLAAFFGWWLLGGQGWDHALLIAVAVLIITCPCALGLAVPAVQVIAAGRLMRRGVLLKSGTALERLVDVDTIIFDKTGTLTDGRLALTEAPDDPDALLLAARIASRSTHPLARGLVEAARRRGLRIVAAPEVEEVPGAGLIAKGFRLGLAGDVRLGSRRFLGLDDGVEGDGPELWLQLSGAEPVRFAFSDHLREDAMESVAALHAQGFDVRLLSGDRPAAVARVAGQLGIRRWEAGATPADKVRLLEDLVREGRKVAMVGDGLNDAPALAAASVSISPSTAADVAQTAADAVFQGKHLSPILELFSVAKRSHRLVRQNFALAFLYNIVTVPIALAGLVTPLIAALAMSSSSLVVVGNAMRLAGKGRWAPQTRKEAR